MSDYELHEASDKCLHEMADRYAQKPSQLSALAVELAARNKKSETKIDRLRGNLQNAVCHLERAERRIYNGKFQPAIESANKCLYETLHD